MEEVMPPNDSVIVGHIVRQRAWTEWNGHNLFWYYRILVLQGTELRNVMTFAYSTLLGFIAWLTKRGACKGKEGGEGDSRMIKYEINDVGAHHWELGSHNSVIEYE